MFSSDTYAGCSIEKLDFYYGSEVTKCMIHSDKSDEYCADIGCSEREWCFVASFNDKDLWIICESEMRSRSPEMNSYSPLECLITGMEIYFRENRHLCSLHLIDESISMN